MLKDIRKSKKTPAPAPAPHTDANEKLSDATQAFIDQWLEHLCEERPDLAAAISKPLIMKNALDSALDSGVYSIYGDDVIDELEKKAPDKSKVKKKETKDNKSRKGKGRGKHKGLKKPHTDI